MTEEQILYNACKTYIVPRIVEEFEKQGHSLSGAWEDSVTVQEEDGGAAIYALSYGMIVDAGITPDRIPFGGIGTGSGGEISEYILGLVKFWQLRKPGITAKAALKLAFATARVQKQEGMSTEASKVFSSTGLRQHFMDELEAYLVEVVDFAVFTGLDILIEQEAASPKVMYI